MWTAWYVVEATLLLSTTCTVPEADVHTDQAANQPSLQLVLGPILDELSPYR